MSSSRAPIVSLVQEIRLNLRLMMNRWTLWAKWSRCRTYVKLCAKRYQRYARINFSFMIDTLQTVRNSISIRNELKYLRESFKKTECETCRDSRWLAYSLVNVRQRRGLSWRTCHHCYENCSSQCAFFCFVPSHSPLIEFLMIWSGSIWYIWNTIKRIWWKGFFFLQRGLIWNAYYSFDVDFES